MDDPLKAAEQLSQALLFEPIDAVEAIAKQHGFSVSSKAHNKGLTIIVTRHIASGHEFILNFDNGKVSAKVLT